MYVSASAIIFKHVSLNPPRGAISHHIGAIGAAMDAPFFAYTASLARDVVRFDANLSADGEVVEDAETNADSYPNMRQVGFKTGVRNRGTQLF